jgi:transcriptional regulator with XRE-family HTH domain
MKLDFNHVMPHNNAPMQKVLRSESVKSALTQKGWTQKDLAAAVGVSAQSVTNWFKGEDFPRPDKLLRLASTLKLRLDELVQTNASVDKPVVAFRRHAATKTTAAHIEKAQAMGALLCPLVAYLPPLRALRTELPKPSTAYAELQRAVAQTRDKLGVGQRSVLQYEALTSEFAANDAFIVPVLWGEKQQHQNALHILLPAQRVTFIYLNLDTYIEDFKFWMAHELAHVYTPVLAGSEDGEDFADAFAGALLCPEGLAEQAYLQAAAATRKTAMITTLQRHAREHSISLFTVYRQVQAYAQAHHGTPLPLNERTDIHAIRSTQRGPLVSTLLFDPLPPEPAAYLSATRHAFGSEFFPSLQRLLREQGTGATYVQQILDVPLADAAAIHATLTR